MISIQMLQRKALNILLYAIFVQKIDYQDWRKRKDGNEEGSGTGFKRPMKVFKPSRRRRRDIQKDQISTGEMT